MSGWRPTRSGLLIRGSGVDVATRPALNFIAGSGISLTISDDAVNEDVDVIVSATGGGGGGAVPEWVSYLAARQSDETPHADDDFFEDGTKTGWTEATIAGTAVWTEARGLMSVKASGGTTGDAAVCVKPITASGPPLSIESAVTMWDIPADFHSVGICFTDGTVEASNVVSMRLSTRSTGADSFQVYTGTLGNADATARVSLSRSGPAALGRIYMRLVQTASNTWAANFSHAGVPWEDLGLAPFSFTFTPTHYGMIASNFAGTRPLMASWDYFRVYEANLDV